ncbi:DUF3048 domain-containing protein [bacterium]|nr:DUF3048 domain-containing protein [bacterium]
MLLLLLTLSACTTIGTGEPNPYLVTPDASTVTEPATATTTPTETAEPSPTLTQAVTLPPAVYYYFEPGVSPLTGLPAADPANLDRRPVMAKVSNWPREGRPHAGLSNADIVFEYFIGYQMNRFLAIYYGQDSSVIGPIRSGRLVDPQLVQLYQGIFAYGNADPQVDEVIVEKLGDRAFAFKDLPCPPMCGEVTHSATGVFLDSAAMTDYAGEAGATEELPDLRGMHFEDEPPAGDAPGTIMRVEYANFSIMEWRYDVESNTYRLWQEGVSGDELVLAEMTDRNTGEPLAFDNLVVMFADYIEHAPSLHDIAIQNETNPQKAWFFRDGERTEGTWRVPEPDRPIIFETELGESFPFKPGRTWIVIVGNSSEIDQPAEGEWTLYFGL